MTHNIVQNVLHGQLRPSGLCRAMVIDYNTRTRTPPTSGGFSACSVMHIPYLVVVRASAQLRAFR